MEKGQIIRAFVEELKKELNLLSEAARATYQAATHEESKAENQYDTRGLEASYLAGAQAKRVMEIDKVLTLFERGSFKTFKESDPIDESALVEVETEAQRSFVFVLNTGGGVSLKYNGKAVRIVTPQSMLGEAMIGLSKNDTAEVEVGHELREYKIISVM